LLLVKKWYLIKIHPFPLYTSLDRGTVRVKCFAKKIIQGLLFGSDFIVFSCQKGDLIWCSALLMIQAFLWWSMESSFINISSSFHHLWKVSVGGLLTEKYRWAFFICLELQQYYHETIHFCYKSNQKVVNIFIITILFLSFPLLVNKITSIIWLTYWDTKIELFCYFPKCTPVPMQ